MLDPRAESSDADSRIHALLETSLYDNAFNDGVNDFIAGFSRDGFADVNELRHEVGKDCKCFKSTAQKHAYFEPKCLWKIALLMILLWCYFVLCCR
jgi:hypothetical protein